MSRPLEKIVREAREDWGTRASRGIDWETVDKALFDRLDRERIAEAKLSVRKPSGPWGIAAAGVVAAGAVLAVGMGKGRDPSPPVEARIDTGAGAVVAIEGGGHAIINRTSAAKGAALHVGDVIESRDAQLTIERPGKLTMILERDSRVTITRAEGSLVVALDRGAVEARVVPVASGEAFAVDVESSRVAVHGTHLRVARAGAHVVIDLSEGVVSIGDTPRTGTVLGTLVVAPAHAEFSAGLPATLVVTHDASILRQPTVLASAELPPPAVVVAPPVSSKAEPNATRPSSIASPRSEVRSTPSSIASSAASESDPTAAVANAVRACMAEQTPAENVTVQVKTTLYLSLQDDGSVRAARFEPPVAPDVNECATPAIYKAHFAHGGSVSVELSVVSSQGSP